jgi:hypothetical protein
MRDTERIHSKKKKNPRVILEASFNSCAKSLQRRLCKDTKRGQNGRRKASQSSVVPEKPREKGTTKEKSASKVNCCSESTGINDMTSLETFGSGTIRIHLGMN